jgi:hypothetical protein
MGMGLALSMIGSGTLHQYLLAAQMQLLTEVLKKLPDIFILPRRKAHPRIVGLVINDRFQGFIDDLKGGFGVFFFGESGEKFEHQHSRRLNFGRELIGIFGINHEFCSVGCESMGQIIRSGVLSARPETYEYCDSTWIAACERGFNITPELPLQRAE